MIFDVTPDQIEGLDSKELVELLRRLLHAEAQLAGISLSAVSVPLQITIADGGEDARIKWEGGHDRTEYLPSRFTVFQSKATDPGKAGWKKETWTKKTQRAPRSKQAGKRRKATHQAKLNDALTVTLAARGAYIGFTSTPLVGPKYDERVQAIRDGVSAAGGDAALITVDIYDANKVAGWASQHPSVAVWLNELRSGLALGGFHTVGAWGARPDIAAVPHSSDNAARYILGGKSSVDENDSNEPATNGLTSAKAVERISYHLSQPRKAVRLFGPSGIGKTRFAYELACNASSVSKFAAGVSTIYCDYRTVGQQLLAIADIIARLRSPTWLIIDECPREVARQLLSAVTVDGSQLRLLTIDVDDRPIISDDCLNIAVGPSDEALIESIIKTRLRNPKADQIDYIKKICGGFPRIAVLATENDAQHSSVLGSIGDVVERILSASGVVSSDDVRALEVLALFESLGVDKDVAGEIDFVAERLAGSNGDRMYEILARASKHQLVGRRGRFFVAQPFPIAAFLGLRRLELMRVQSLIRFIEDAPPEILQRFFARWRHFDLSRVAIDVAEQLLSASGKFGSRKALESDFGAECLDDLVHVAPDAAADTLNRILGHLSIDELKGWHRGRRGMVRALEKLVFRLPSFASAARILLRLAAAENEQWSNNSKGLFTQLFQRQLSGTEAAPRERYIVLDDGLASNEPEVVSVCIEALEKTLHRHHFTRSGGAEQIGSKPPLEDWFPTTWKDAFDFHREGLRRLVKLRSNENLRERCEKIITSHIRGLLVPALVDEVEEVLLTLAQERPVRLDVLHGIGDWLYFERPHAPKEFGERVRAFYDRVAPTDLVEKALLYTKFWSADIRDPDTVYSKSNHDFEYSTRKAREIAKDIASDLDLTSRIVQEMAAESLNNVFPFAQELGRLVSNPKKIFHMTLSIYESRTGRSDVQFMRGLLSGIDSRDKVTATECMGLALKSSVFVGQAVNLYTSVSITSDRVSEIVKQLRDGSLAATDCTFLSYGRGLDGLTPAEILPLLTELMSGRGPEGLWTAFEVISMYQLGRVNLDPTIERLLKQLSTAPEILKRVPQPTRDAHLLQSSVAAIRKHGLLDDVYAMALSEQVVRLCQVKDYAIFQDMDDAARAIVKILAEDKPVLLWLAVSRFFEMATPAEREMLEKVVGSARRTFDDAEGEELGLLTNLPEEQVNGWAAQDPHNRVAFLTSFYPLLVKDDAGNQNWHAGIESLASQFGGIKEFRDALARRFHPRSWSGSLVPYFQAYIAPLEEWRNHSIPELAGWAFDMQRRLQRAIRHERRSDAEHA